MPDATTFAELFGGVFPTEPQVEVGVEYGPLGDNLIGTAILHNTAQEEILEAIEQLGDFYRPIPGGTLKELIIHKNGHPVDGAAVWITTDSEGGNVVAGTAYTNTAGKVRFMLEAGITYYAWCQKAGVNFTNPTQINVP